MKMSNFSKMSPTRNSVPAQRMANHQHSNKMNGMATTYQVSQLQAIVGEEAVMQLFAGNRYMSQVAQRAAKDNNTGMPIELRSGLESLSGHSMSDVKVHYNSSKPATLNAHAYAQGNDIHIGPGQEQHLPHEGWHIVQQKQGRVQPTRQLHSAVINDDAKLEKEADIMGAKAYERGSSMVEGIDIPTVQTSPASSVLQGKFGTGKESNVPVKSNTPILDKAIQLLSRSNPVIQRVLTLDNADFSGVTRIQKLGGAEGAYLIEEDSSKIVIKVDVKIDDKDTIESTVMSYNLAKDFDIKIPSARYLKLDTEEGQILIAKAKEYPELDLAKKLEDASSVTLWEYIDGRVLGDFKDKGLEEDAVFQFRENPENFVDLGKMLVFDAAIFNIDRFKIETDQVANRGNLMVAGNQPVGLDQDFARFDNFTTPGENIEGAEWFTSKMKKLLSNPEVLAQLLVEKMLKEHYYLFIDMEEHITGGIREGIEILRNLANEENPRLEDLISWSKTFNPDTDLETEKVRAYWNSLIN